MINDLAAQDQSIVLVLDDFHTIRNPSIHAGIQFLLEHLPHNLHIILSTRTDPPYPLARFRARDQLIEIRTRDLRFNRGEAAQFLTQTMGLNLAVEDVAALEERTEGWAAGLQLAALSMRGRSDIHAFIEAFTGSHLYVAEYLMEEVLRQQSEVARSFLLKTSILLRITSELCEAVTGCEDGQAILQALHKTNAFLIPLDNEGRWFRYHHLFSDLLRARLPQICTKDEIAALHRRASIWYERNGDTIEAVNHALAAEDFEKVTNLVKQAAHTLIFTGQVNILREWLDVLPESSIHAHSHLIFYRFWIDLLQRKADLSDQIIKEMEDLQQTMPPSPENKRLQGELMAVLCRAMVLSGRTSSTIRLAREALDHLPSEDLASRARANSALAVALDLEDHTEEASRAYQECLSQSFAVGDYLLASHTLMAKGLIQYRSGQLQKAAKTYQKVSHLKDRIDATPFEMAEAASTQANITTKVYFPAGQGYIGLASIYLERNDLKTAENYLRKGLDLCLRGGLDGGFFGRILMSRLRQARGDLAGALVEIQMPGQAFKDQINLATRQIRIELAEENLEGAWHRAETMIEILNNDPAAFQPPWIFIEVPEVSIARVYLAKGEVEKTMQILDRFLSKTRSDRRAGRLVEVYLLKALAYLKQNDGVPAPEAIENINRALELGEQEGYFLLFLEEGRALIPLLNKVVNRQSASPRARKFARRLLGAFTGNNKPSAQPVISDAANLVEPLTPREMEVLALLAAGDSNQEIAEKLTITVRTVKKHTGNIYGKLGASSRIQAVTRARALGLLPMD